MIAYKIVRRWNSKLFSFGYNILQNQSWTVEYIPDIAVIPSYGKCLFVFDTVENALKFLEMRVLVKYDCELWKCEITVDDREFITWDVDFYGHLNTGHIRGKEIFPEGTVWASSVKLLEKLK